VRFWDSSALVQLYVEQRFSAPLRKLYVKEPRIAVWWGTQTECVRAFCRLCREGRFGKLNAEAERTRDLILGFFGNDWRNWVEIEPTEQLRKSANGLVQKHAGLSSADALQLGAALAAADGSPRDVGFVCCDDRLCKAAVAEGFVVPLEGSTE
jgi:predicted nucleic acid-binding protein